MTIFEMFRRYSLLRLPAGKLPVAARNDLHRELSYTQVNPFAKQPEDRYIETPLYTWLNPPQPTGLIEDTDWLTGLGALQTVARVVRKHGYEPRLYTLDPDYRASSIRCHGLPRDILKYEPRDWQQRCWELMLKYPRCVIQSPTGTGKTKLVTFLCQLWSHARILYTTAGKGNVQDVFQALIAQIPSVQHIKRGGQVPDSRVICCTAGLIHHLTGSFDVMLVDECQEVCTPTKIQSLLAVPAYRVYGLTANACDRMDRSDRWIEVLCGERHVIQTYTEGVADGDIVPIEVRWQTPEVIRPRDFKTKWAKDRYYVWRNPARNKLIAADAERHVKAGDQVLITVRTLEHALHLRQLLRCEIAYGETNNKRWQQMQALGLVEAHESPTTAQEQADLKRRFAAGECRLAVATTIWNRAVDFRQLSVLIRADAGGTDVNSVQIPGRLSRTHTASGKQCGILYDYADSEPPYKNRAAARRKIYTREKHKQINFNANFAPYQPSLFGDDDAAD